MVFTFPKDPDNRNLKNLLSWKDKLVIDCQRANLMNRIRDEVWFRSRLMTYMELSSEPVLTEDGKAMLPKGTKITFYTVQNREGMRFFPVFTDREELDRWEMKGDARPRTVLVTFDDLMPVLRANAAFEGIVINPMSDNLLLLKSAIEDWTKQKAFIMKQLREQQEKMNRSAEEK